MSAQRMLLPCVLLALFGPVQLKETGPVDADSANPSTSDLDFNRLIAELHANKDLRDISRRRAAFVALENHRLRMVRDMSQIAERTKENYNFFDTRGYAVQLLAHYGGIDAIPVLIRNIEYNEPAVLSADRLASYPCARALVRRIGPTCISPILNYLQLTPTDKVSDNAISLYAHVLHSCAMIYTPLKGSSTEAIKPMRLAIEQGQLSENVKRLLAELEKRERGT